ncbi:MAG: MopE-related protein [Myxococcales bacterium]
MTAVRLSKLLASSLLLSLLACGPQPSGPDAGEDRVDAAALSDASTVGPDAAAAPADSGVGADASVAAVDAGAATDAGTACQADLQTDDRNCGECGRVCELYAAFSKCVSGQCVVDFCAPGYWDVDTQAGDGCEYACLVSGGGVEACDGLDNDCNGVTDDGFDLSSDPNHCGACGTVCALPHAHTACVAVDGAPRCVLVSCLDGFADLDPVLDGCEHSCPVWPATAERCNGLDDDCDGTVDEDGPESGAPCESTCPGGACLGECTSGRTLCSGGTLACLPGQGPELESCNGRDDDCDGATDEGFDLQRDPRHCGQCGHACQLAGAVAACLAGECAIASCLPGAADLDGEADDGCEYTCPVYPPRVETCNGLDDDCNGVTDDASAVAALKPPAAGCHPNPGTPCAGADFVCAGAGGWRCHYGPGVELDAAGALALVEARCDGLDGNCNGQVDESFPDLGVACDNELLGACRDVGKRVCDPGAPTATTCDLSVLPDPVPGAPRTEVCNGQDDDCNGITDDGIVDDMVLITRNGLSFYVDRYEASRPDATASTPGTRDARRCTVAGVLPWTTVSYAEAASACGATGARLCTAAEFQAACEGPSANAFPYGATYQPQTCNGLDYDAFSSSALLHGSALAACLSAEGIYDLSGNAAEWTSTLTGNTGAPLNLSIYLAKGGSYQTPEAGLTCQFTLSRYSSNSKLADLGFRCCK